MKRLLWGMGLLALVLGSPLPAPARVEVGISISLPPIVFAGPVEVVVIPGTYVYAVPDLEVDIFFYDGWWWRPWEGRWYRSRHYDSGWGYYRSVPSFYGRVPSRWRNDYRERRWEGRQWNYQRIPQQQLQRNWRTWEKSRHWEKQQTWGVQGFKPRPHSQAPSREAAQPGRYRGEQPQRSQPQPHEGLQPQRFREFQPQRSQPPSRETSQPGRYRGEQPQRSQPPSREMVQPPRSREVQPPRAQPRQGKSERGREEK